MSRSFNYLHDQAVRPKLLHYRGVKNRMVSTPGTGDLVSTSPSSVSVEKGGDTTTTTSQTGTLIASTSKVLRTGHEKRVVNPTMTAVQPEATVENFSVEFPHPVNGKPIRQLIDKAIPAQNEFMNFEVYSEEKGKPRSGGAPSTQTKGQKLFHEAVRKGVWVTVTSRYAKRFGYERGQKIFLKEGQNFVFVDTENLEMVKEGTKTVFGTGESGEVAKPPRLRRGGKDLGPVKEAKLFGSSGIFDPESPGLEALQMASAANTEVASSFIYDLGARDPEKLLGSEENLMYLAGYSLQSNIFAPLGYIWAKDEPKTWVDKIADNLVGVQGPKMIVPGLDAEDQRLKFMEGKTTKVEQRTDDAVESRSVPNANRIPRRSKERSVPLRRIFSAP